MQLNEKISCLRQKENWSQEQLAEKLNVSRQAVSKWESGQSLPDIEKIITMAGLFHVTTDYLLKDNPQSTYQENSVPFIEPSEVNNFLSLRKKASKAIAFGVSLCICAPIFILIGVALGELNITPADASLGTSLILLIITVAAAVGIFIHSANSLAPYEYLEKSNFKLHSPMTNQLEKDRNSYRPTYSKLMSIGVMLCILAVIPIFFGAFFTSSSGSSLDQIMLFFISILLLIVSIGVNLIVKTNIVKESYDILLQDNDYSIARKNGREKLSNFTPIYWASITLIYFIFSFSTHHWEISWVIWVFGGIIYGIIDQIVSYRKKIV